MSQPDSPPPEVLQPNSSAQLVNSVQNFLAGTCLVGVPLFACLSLSLYTTHTPIAAVSPAVMGMAIAVPILFGCVSIVYKDRAVELIGDALASVNLPF